MIRFGVLCFIRMFWRSLFTSEVVACYPLFLYTHYGLSWSTTFMGITSCMPCRSFVVCSIWFGGPAYNFVSRTAILCRSLWQLEQKVNSRRVSYSFFNVGSCVFPSPECKLSMGGWSDIEFCFFYSNPSYCKVWALCWFSEVKIKGYTDKGI